MDLAQQKRALRRAMRARREQLPPDLAMQASLAALAKLQKTPEWQRASQIALFASFAGEIPTQPIFRAAREAGKRVSLPRMESSPEARSPLAFVEVERWEDLRAGRWGVPEPAPELAPRTLDAATLVLVPGLAFDRQGHRLGMGKGYYDRALATLALPVRFGFAFEFQLVDAVPYGPTDQAVVAIVTEVAVHRVRPG